MPPVAEVCVLVFIPFGKGNHEIVYPGTGEGGLNVRFRLNALTVLVQLVCVNVGAIAGCAKTETVEIALFVTTIFAWLVPVINIV